MKRISIVDALDLTVETISGREPVEELVEAAITFEDIYIFSFKSYSTSVMVTAKSLEKAEEMIANYFTSYHSDEELEIMLESMRVYELPFKSSRKKDEYIFTYTNSHFPDPNDQNVLSIRGTKSLLDKFTLRDMTSLPRDPEAIAEFQARDGAIIRINSLIPDKYAMEILKAILEFDY